MEFDKIRNVSLPFIKVYTFESSYHSLHTLLKQWQMLTNAIKWSLHNYHYQPCEAQMLSLRSGCYIFSVHFSNSRFIVCEITPVPQWMRFLFWCHSFISPLGQQTLPSWECAHTRTLDIMLTLSPSSPFLPSVFLQKELHLRSVLVYVREEQKWASIPHLHNDLHKKLLTASGLHAWGTFLKTYCVYQGFLYIECQKYYILYRMHYVISNILFVYNQ